jgi:FMN phosphatase YigB (HAD superfamily)
MTDQRTKYFFLDVDDLLLSFFCPFHEWMSLNTKYKISKSYIPKNWDYSEIPMDEGDDIGKFINMFVETNSDNLPPFPGASNLTKELKKRGFTIILITAYPHHLGMRRIANLRKYDIVFDHIYFTSFMIANGDKCSVDKAELMTALGYNDSSKYKVYFADDRASSVIKFVKAGLGTGFTIKRSYNLDVLKELEEEDEEIFNKMLVSRGGFSKTAQVENLFKLILSAV